MVCCSAEAKRDAGDVDRRLLVRLLVFLLENWRAISYTQPKTWFVVIHLVVVLRNLPHV